MKLCQYTPQYVCHAANELYLIDYKRVNYYIEHWSYDNAGHICSKVGQMRQSRGLLMFMLLLLLNLHGNRQSHSDKTDRTSVPVEQGVLTPCAGL